MISKKIVPNLSVFFPKKHYLEFLSFFFAKIKKIINFPKKIDYREQEGKRIRKFAAIGVMLFLFTHNSKCTRKKRSRSISASFVPV